MINSAVGLTALFFFQNIKQNPNIKLYVNTVAKKTNLLALVLDVFVVFISILILYKKRISGSTEQITLYCHRKRLI